MESEWLAVDAAMDALARSDYNCEVVSLTSSSGHGPPSRCRAVLEQKSALSVKLPDDLSDIIDLLERQAFGIPGQRLQQLSQPAAKHGRSFSIVGIDPIMQRQRSPTRGEIL